MLIFSTFGISSALIGMGVYFHFKGLEEKLCLNGLSGNGTTSISTLSTNGTGKTDITRRQWYNRGQKFWPKMKAFSLRPSVSASEFKA